MSFQISALPRSTFEHLFTLTAQQLNAHRAIRVLANQKPGFPCRVSLADAEIGEEVILVNYEHHNTTSPFQASHAVYVRPAATEAHLAPNEVPDQFRTRTISLRGFDAGGMLMNADLSEGSNLEPAIEQLFKSDAIAYIHLHYAKPGCYAAKVLRAA